MGWLSSYDNWKASTNEPETIHVCHQCDGDIYEGMDFFTYDNLCFDEVECLCEYLEEHNIIYYNPDTDYYIFEDDEMSFEDKCDCLIYLEKHYCNN